MLEERLDAKLTMGSASYFIREGTPRGGQNALIVGPRRPSDAVQHHLTLVSDIETGEIDNIHLTGMKGQERKKKWQIVPDEVESKIARWIRDNSDPMAKSDVREMGGNYYCVSGWRVFTGFRIVEGMMTVATSLFVRLLMGLGLLSINKERGKNGGVRVLGQLNITGVLALAHKFRPFKRIIQAVLAVVVTRGGPRLLRLFLMKPERMSRGDVSLLVPKSPALPAMVLVKWEEHRRIDLGKLIEQAANVYHRWELQEIIPDPARLSSLPHLPFVFDIRGRIGS